MNKKGFTLIELLAVIVILAIIALIATPAVLNIIEDSKLKSIEISTKNIISAAETEYTKQLLNNKKTTSIDMQDNVLKYEGKKVNKGKIFFDNNGKIYSKFYIDEYCVERNYNGSIVIEKIEETFCNISLPISVGEYVKVEVSKNETRNFIVLSTDDDKVTLLLDSQIGEPTVWSTEEDLSEYVRDNNIDVSNLTDEEARDFYANAGALAANKQLPKDWHNADEVRIPYAKEIIEHTEWYKNLSEEDKENWLTLYKEIFEDMLNGKINSGLQETNKYSDFSNNYNELLLPEYLTHYYVDSVNVGVNDYGKTADIFYWTQTGVAGNMKYLNALNIPYVASIIMGTHYPFINISAIYGDDLMGSLINNMVNDKLRRIRPVIDIDKKYIVDVIEENENFELLTLTIQTTGGKLSSNIYKYHKGMYLGTLPTPTKNGYTFKGYTDANGNLVDNNTLINNNMTIFANWEVNNYEVTFVYNNGQENVTKTLTYGEKYGELEVPTKEGYIFQGWKLENGTELTNDSVVKVAANHSVYAQWQKYSPYPHPEWDMNDQYVFVATNNSIYVSYQKTASSTTTTYYAEAVPIYEGIKIKYYDDSGKYKEVDLSGTSVVPTGSENKNANEFIYELEDGSILKMKYVSGWASGASTHQFALYNEKIYIYPQNLDDTTYTRKSVTNQNFDVKIEYIFVDPNGIETESKTINWFNSSSNNSSISVVQWKTFDSVNGKSNSTCVTADTLITLANGTQKRIDKITYEDEILVWDFYNGKYTTTTASIIENHGYSNNVIIKLTFEDGTIVKVVNAHGFFDETLNKWVDITEYNVNGYINHNFMQLDKDGYKTIKLINAEVTYEKIEAWSILTNKYYNCIMENMFSITPPATEQLAFYEIGEDMKYDQFKMLLDINKYGLYKYEEFEHLMSKEAFAAFNVAEIKIAVGKGLITYEEVIELIKKYTF